MGISDVEYPVIIGMADNLIESCNIAYKQRKVTGKHYICVKRFINNWEVRYYVTELIDEKDKHLYCTKRGFYLDN